MIKYYDGPNVTLFSCEVSCTKWTTGDIFHEWKLMYEKKWWTRCDKFSWMKFHTWKMWWTGMTFSWMKFHTWKNVMDEMWHFREWSFLYKISHYSACFCEWICVRKCHVWSIAKSSTWSINEQFSVDIFLLSTSLLIWSKMLYLYHIILPSLHVRQDRQTGTDNNQILVYPSCKQPLVDNTLCLPSTPVTLSSFSASTDPWRLTIKCLVQGDSSL